MKNPSHVPGSRAVLWVLSNQVVTAALCVRKRRQTQVFAARCAKPTLCVLPAAAPGSPWQPGVSGSDSHWTQFSCWQRAPLLTCGWAISKPASLQLPGAECDLSARWDFSLPEAAWLQYQDSPSISSSSKRALSPASPGNVSLLSLFGGGSVCFWAPAAENVSNRLSVMAANRAVIPWCCQISKGNPSALSYNFL